MEMTPAEQNALKQILFYIRWKLSINPLVVEFDLHEIRLSFGNNQMKKILDEVIKELKMDDYDLKYDELWISFVNRGNIKIRKCL